MKGGKLEEDGRLEGGEMGFECNEEAAVEFEEGKWVFGY